MKAFWISLISVLCIVILFFLFLPQLASTSWGKNIFVKLAFGDYSTKTSVGSLNLSWFGPQEMENLEVRGNEVEVELEYLHADISLFSLFTLGDLDPDIFEKVNGKVEIQNGSVHFPLQNTKFHNIQGELDHSDNDAPLSFSMRGASIERGNQGTFIIKGHVDHLGKEWDDFICKGNVELNNIPTAGIDSLVSFHFPKLDHVLIQILGPIMTLHSNVSIDQGTGRIDGDLRSTRLKTYLDATFSHGVITLNRDLIASIQLTPALSNYLLRDFNPLFITGIEAENPIRLEIYSRNFSFPVRPFDIRNVKMKANLDMGRIRCQNGGTLSLLISLMKYHTLFGVHEMNVWFTPVNIELQQGYAVTDRMDALVADSIHVCTWGKINLKNDKIDMILGFTRQALEQAFHISNLPRDYVMQIPLTGTTKDPKIDMGKAAAKIAALIAINATDKTKGFLGGLLGKTIAPEPPPKLPFPWEGKVQPVPKDRPEAQDFFDLFKKN